MKKLLLSLLIVFTFAACKKDETPTINAPSLPSSGLSWGMSAEEVNASMQAAGYAANSKGLFVKSDSYVAWYVKYNNGLYALTYHYFGDNTEWARLFWANIIGLGDKYSKGFVGWNTIRKEIINTDNSKIVIDNADYITFTLGGKQYKSTVTAYYSAFGP